MTNSDQVASPADPKTKAAGDESNRNRIAVERINPSSTEPILVRGRFSITRAEARDYFEKISARRGLRAEWDTLIIATSDHEQTPAPHPDFRRLWIEASCAGHFMGKVQQVESEWSSLFGSTSELLIFHEEEVVGSLMELLGINESLAGVVARSGFDGRKDADAAVMRSGLRVDSPGPGGNEGASQLSQAARVSSESESVAAAEIRSNKTRAGSSPTTRKGIHRSPVESGRPLHRGGHSITRAEARAYVKNISDRLNAGSAWDRPVGARPGREQTYDLPILVREAAAAAAAAGPQLFNSQDAVNHRPRDDNWASPSALTPQSDNTAARLTGARSRTRKLVDSRTLTLWPTAQCPVKCDWIKC